MSSSTPSRPLKALMGLLVAVSLLLLPTAPASAQTAAAPVSDKDYVLRFGDALNVYVLENENLEVDDQPIRPDGRISLPLVGDMQASGLTLPQLHDRLAKAYGKYFVEPHVVVSVGRFRPLNISVVGLVNRPNTFPVPEPVRLLQAIGLAGGVEHMRGDYHRVAIVRANGTQRMLDLQAVLDGKAEDNVLLYDGDTVRVYEVDGPDWYRILPTVAASISLLSSIVVIVINATRK